MHLHYLLGISWVGYQVIAAQAASTFTRRAQHVFPPTNGPCPQNAGNLPYTCSEKSCIDIPAQGICNIQTQQGFPICGCCEEEEKVSCSSCGGDIGGGICKGTGSHGIAYQGCACTTDGGELPNPSNLCPENNGKSPPACTDTSCSPKNIHIHLDGLCTQRTPSFGPTYTYCACCPESPSPLACDPCGGNDGHGKCNGVDAYYGFAYRGCSCTKNGGKGPEPIIIIPFPIPPIGFPPIVPPGTPNPKQQCPASPLETKCDTCEGKQNWCQAGPLQGCPCTNSCEKLEQEPVCSDDDCQGTKDNKCSIGPSQECNCKNACPTGDKMPQCSDKACKGDADNKCTTGDNKDCECKSCPTKPTEMPVCDHKDCSGSKNQGKWTCTQGSHKGCRCLPRAKLLDIHLVSKPFLVWQAAYLRTLLATPPKSRPGTTIHVNAGCISINGSPRCAPQTYNVSDQGKDKSTATIYAQFNGQDTTDKNVIPGCELNATWPRSYGDIYFGQGNCLYDSSSKVIDGQCCTAKTTTSVANPYFKQSTPNNAGTNIHISDGCININGSPRCAPQTYNVADQGKDKSTATIYAQFNGQDTTDVNVVPGCKLTASWPRGYHDIYFGQKNSNCLYDSGNNRIDGQCCTSKTTTSVANPYFKKAPSAPSSTSNPSKPECTSFAGWSCKKNCIGSTPCPGWCDVNCGGILS
ncbi:hypothetical protein V8E54_009338 [Elaphomyces granulatus]